MNTLVTALPHATATHLVPRFFAGRATRSPLKAFSKPAQKLLQEIADSFGVTLEMVIPQYLALLSILVGKRAFLFLDNILPLINASLAINMFAERDLGKSRINNVFCSRLSRPDLIKAVKLGFPKELEEALEEYPQIISRCTQIGLLYALEKSQGILSAPDELTAMRETWGKPEARANLIDLIDGIYIDRFTGKGKIVIDYPFLSLIAGTQPERAYLDSKSGFYKKDDIDSGLAARIIFIEGFPSHKEKTRAPLSDASIEYLDTITYASLDRKLLSGQNVTVYMTPTAWQLYEQYRRFIEGLQKSDHKSLIPFYGRQFERMPRIALCLHCSNAVEHSTPDETNLSVETLQRAICLSYWLLERERICWKKYLGLGKEIGLSEAVKRAIVRNQYEIDSNEGVMRNGRFRKLVETEMNGIKLTPSALGKVAKRLGLETITKHEGRCIRVTPDKVLQFRREVEL